MTETNGMKIVERINEICEKKGIVRKKIAQDLDIADNSFSTWSARGTIPAADIALKIAKYLNVSLEWLITGTEPEELRLEEREILEKWNSLEEGQKETVTILLNALSEQNAKKERSPKAGA